MGRFSTFAIAAGLLGGAAMLSTPADAALLVGIDFSTGGNNTNLGQTENVGGVVANAFVGSPTGAAYVATDLWRRNQTNDHGFGVCSEGNASCLSGGGDVNELDNMNSDELIQLVRPDGQTWSAFQLSSLDGDGDAGGGENGIAYFSNTALTSGTTTLATLSAAALSSISFAFAGGTVEPLFNGFTAAQQTAKYIYFVAGGGPNGGVNNDYLVYGVSTVPLPGAALLFGTALAGLGWARQRRGEAQPETVAA